MPGLALIWSSTHFSQIGESSLMAPGDSGGLGVQPPSTLLAIASQANRRLSCASSSFFWPAGVPSTIFFTHESKISGDESHQISKSGGVFCSLSITLSDMDQTSCGLHPGCLAGEILVDGIDEHLVLSVGADGHPKPALASVHRLLDTQDQTLLDAVVDQIGRAHVRNPVT